MGERCNDIDKKLNEHISIYMQNGKELARLALAVEFMTQRAEKRDAKVDEMFAVYQEFKFGRKGLVWLFGIFTAVGAAILMVKGILR